MNIIHFRRYSSWNVKIRQNHLHERAVCIVCQIQMEMFCFCRIKEKSLVWQTFRQTGEVFTVLKFTDVSKIGFSKVIPDSDGIHSSIVSTPITWKKASNN